MCYLMQKSILSPKCSYVSTSGILRQLVQVFAKGKWSLGLMDCSYKKTIDGWGEKPTGGRTLAPIAKARILAGFEGPTSSNT